MALIKRLIDAVRGKHPISAARSSRWPAVRKRHLELHPACEACGGRTKVEVHHIHPFHLHPDLELDPTNLITLCEAKKGGINCHLAWGHLGTYTSWNVSVIANARAWLAKIKNRPGRA